MGLYFEAEPGCDVGEIGVVLNVPRTAFCMAKNYTVLSILSTKNFKLLESVNPNFTRVFKKQMSLYRDKYLIDLKKMIWLTIYEKRDAKIELSAKKARPLNLLLKRRSGININDNFLFEAKRNEIMTEMIFQM